MNCYHSLPSSHSSHSSHTHPCPVPITHTCFLHTSPTTSPAPHSLFAHVPRITHLTLLILHKGIPHTSPLLSPHQLTPSSPPHPTHTQLTSPLSLHPSPSLTLQFHYKWLHLQRRRATGGAETAMLQKASLSR